MTIIFLTEYNTRCYGVTFQNNGCIRVQKFEDISNHENNILHVKPIQVLLGKSEVCDMTIMSGALNKSVFDGYTILLDMGEENDKHRFIKIGGDMICSFLTDDNIHKYISYMGNNLTPYSIAIGDQIIYILTPHFKLIKRHRIDDNENFVDFFSIIMIQIVAKTRLRNCKNIKFIKFYLIYL